MNQQIAAEVIGIVHHHTLYETSKLSPDAHLEGELGIDSVLLASIVASLRERFQLGKQTLAEPPSTLREMIDAVATELQRAPARAESSPDLSKIDGVLDRVVEAVVRHTHYPAEKIGLDADLEGELGIDSVILASICADLRRDLSLPAGVLDPSGLRTVRDFLSALGAEAPKQPVAPPPPPPAPPPAAVSKPNGSGSLASLIERYVGKPAPGGRIAEAQLAQLHGAIERELSIEPALRLRDCDTLEKLTEYLSVASRISEPTPAADAWDGRTMKDFVELRDKDLFAKARSFGSFYRRRASDQLYWYGMPLESPCRNRAVIHDEITGTTREFLMFASNNYLGLANDPRVIDAICQAAQKYGATNTGCRLIGGTNLLHKELERRLARFKGREACIVYPSGYSANLGCISALVKAHDAVVVDKLNHMSIVDGCKLSGAVRKIFQHNDMADLERVLERTAADVDGMLIAVDGVFSMHGDIANLPEIVRIAKKYGARVLVDDAHSTGVLGKRGSGTAEHFGLKGEVDLELGTMSKTLGGLGGFVVGDEEVVEYLRFYSNSYVFAANIPAAVAAGLIAAIDIMETEPERIAQLWKNIRRLQSALSSVGFDLGGADSAIVPVVIGDDRKTLELGRAVRARGMFCQTVVYPGVSVGDARLRISVSSEHTDEDLDLAAQIVCDAAREVGVFPVRRA